MAKPLKLEVLLGAIDRATGPLKKITEGSGKTAQALKASRDELRTLQQQQKDVSSYRRANAAMRGTGRALRDMQSKQRDYTRSLDAQREAHVGVKSSLTVARREYDKLSKKVLDAKGPNQQLSAELEKARIRLKGQQEAFDRSSRSIKKYRERTRHTEDQVKRLTSQHDKHQQVLRDTGRRLDDAGIKRDNAGRSARELRSQEDRLTASLEKQQAKLKAVAQHQKRLTAARDRYQKSMGNVARMQGVGAGMLGTGIAKGYAASRLLAPGIAWGEQMSTLQAVGRFDADDERYQALREQSRDLGSSTAFSATEVGGGQEFLLRAGMSADAIQSSMRDVLDLALANNTELARAADISSNIAGAFKIDMEADGAMTRVADVLSGTAARANVNLEMLGDTMKYLGGADDLKLTMEQAAAMAGMLGNIGIQGSQAGTTMRAMMNRLTNPAAKGAAAIEGIGLQVEDANGNMRAMPDILRDISAATESLGNVERKAVLQDIFGAEAGSGMAELVNQMSSGKLDELIQSVSASQGENARMAATMANNVGDDLKSLSSAWDEIGISITDTNEGPLRGLIQYVTEITRGVGDWIKANPELAGTIAKVSAGMIALVTVGGAIALSIASILGPIAMLRYGFALLSINGGGAISMLGRLSPMLMTLGKTAFAGVAGASKLVGAAFMGILKAAGGLLMGLRAFGAIMLAVGKGIMIGLLGALKTVAIFLATTPIGWIIMGIAAAAALIYYNWEKIGPWFASLWESVKQKATAFWEGFKAMPGVVWEAVKAAFSDGIGGITRLLINWSPIGLVYRAITAGLDAMGIEVPERFKTLGGLIIDGLFGGMKAILSSGWQEIKAAFDGGLAGVSALLLDWSPLGLLWRGISAALSQLGIDLPTSFSAMGGHIIDGLLGGIDAKWEALKEKISGMADGITGWFKEKLGINSPSTVFAEFGGNLLDGLINGINAGWQTLKDAIGNTAGAVTNWFKEKLGIRSPSRVFAELGGHTMVGYQQGLKNSENEPLRQVTDFSRRLRQAGAGLALGTASMGVAADIPIDHRPAMSTQPSAGVNITIGDIVVHPSPGMDEQALARYVAAEVQRALRDAERDSAARRRSAFHDID